MVVGILDHQHRHPRHPPRSRALGRGLAARPWRSPSWPRRRWRACRSRSASSPRRRVRGVRARGRSPAAALVLAAAVVGSVLTVAYSARFVLGCFGRRPTAERAALTAVSCRRAAARRVRRPGAGARRWRRVAVGLVPGLLDASSAPPRRALDPPSTACTSRSGTGSTPPLVLSASRSASASRCSPARRRGRPLLARSAAGPDAASDGYRGHRCAASTRSPTASTGSCRTGRCRSTSGHPAHRGRRPGRRCCSPATCVAGLARPGRRRGSRCRSWPCIARRRARRRRRAPPLLGRAVPRRRRLRDGRAVRASRARPTSRSPRSAIETLTTVLFVLVLRRLPDRFETRRRRCGARRCGSPSPRAVGRDGVRRSRSSPARRHPPTTASRRDGRARRARRPRPQRRQRDPRRLPRLRHAGRDHRARRRRRSARWRSPAPAAGPSGDRHGRSPAMPPPACTVAPAGHARGLGAGGLHGRDGRLALPAVRRPQPARRRLRRRARRRRRDRAALHRRRASTRSAAVARRGRGSSSAPACCSPRPPRSCRCCSASRCSRALRGTLDRAAARRRSRSTVGARRSTSACTSWWSAWCYGVRGVRRRPAPMTTSADDGRAGDRRRHHERPPRGHRGGLFALGTYLRAAAQADAASSSGSACSATAPTCCSSRPVARGLPPLIGTGDPARVRRPAAAGARAHRHRDHLRRHRLPARPRLPQLAADRATTRSRTTSTTATIARHGLRRRRRAAPTRRC